MSLTTNVRNRIMDGINTAFAAIGVSGDTKMPKTKLRDNKASYAYEYFVSSHLQAMAKARFEAAKKQAIAVGLIFDHEKQPRDAGVNEQLYNGEHVAVWLTVANGATRVDADKMVDELIAKGVNAKLVHDAYVNATKRSRPAHQFKVSLISADTTNSK